MKPKILPRPLAFKGMALATAVVAGLSLGEARAKSADLDGDGIANLLDPDVDGDGIANGRDLNVDGGVCRRGALKGKYVGDHLLNENPNEKDIDADGFKDSSLAELDIDGDGKKDGATKENDVDGDGRTDDMDQDVDGDGLDNDDFNENDIDGDGISDHSDDDCDGDGKDRDHDDDDDGDGISDDDDGDDDGNTIPDNFEIGGDSSSAIGGSGAVVMTWEPPQIIGPGAFPPDAGLTNVSFGSLEAMSSVSALSAVDTFAFRSSLFEFVGWLESHPENARSLDLGILESGWEFIAPEDAELLTDRVRRLRGDTAEETPAEEMPVNVDETVPSP